MGLFEHFPYSNFHELNLDWLLHSIKTLSIDVKNIEENLYRYTPHFLGDWESGKAYAPLDIVEYDGAYYIATTNVPAGTLPTNKNFYIPTTPNYLGNSNILIVGEYPICNFKTINEAIEKAKKYCSVNNRVSILICTGTYNETVTLLDNPGIDLYGIGNVTINSAAAYPHSPLYTSGDGTFENIRLVSDGSSYGCHIEYANRTKTTAQRIIFKNCYFITTSDKYGAGGFGNGINSYIDCYNCHFVNRGSGSGMYLHAYPINNVESTGSAYFENCTFTSLYIDDVTRMYPDAAANSKMNLTFKQCSLTYGLTYRTGLNPTVSISYFDTIGGVRLTNCMNNNKEVLNHTSFTQVMAATYAPLMSKSGSTPYGAIWMPTPFDATLFRVSASAATMQGYGTMYLKNPIYEHNGIKFDAYKDSAYTTRVESAVLGGWGESNVTFIPN